MRRIQRIQGMPGAAPRQPHGQTEDRPVENRASFHEYYVRLCQMANIRPATEVLNDVVTELDICGESLSVRDWILVCRALPLDQELERLTIRLRRPVAHVLMQLDTELKAKNYKRKSSIASKFIFTEVIEAASSFVQNTKSLVVMRLEGLPLSGRYMRTLANALARSQTLRELSFDDSVLHDIGVQYICGSVKYMKSVQRLSLEHCEMSEDGAVFVADMIKMQAMMRRSRSWQRKGLLHVSVSRNDIGNQGLQSIVEVLDANRWLQTIEFKNCSLTVPHSVDLVMRCLVMHKFRISLNVDENGSVGRVVGREIRRLTAMDDDDYDSNTISPNLKTFSEFSSQHKVLNGQIEMLATNLSDKRQLLQKAEEISDWLIERLREHLGSDMECHQNHTQAKVNNPTPAVAVTPAAPPRRSTQSKPKSDAASSTSSTSSTPSTSLKPSKPFISVKWSKPPKPTRALTYLEYRLAKKSSLRSMCSTNLDGSHSAEERQQREDPDSSETDENDENEESGDNAENTPEDLK